MLGENFYFTCLFTVIFSAVWYFTAFVKPGFINILYRKNRQLMVGLCAALSGFLFLLSIVALFFLIEHYTFML